MAGKVPCAKLLEGVSMPVVGFGTWQADKGKLKEAVNTALECGYRSFDCAYGYLNESEVGEAINDKISSGFIKREEIFLTSKLWNTKHRPEEVKASLQVSLDRLGVDYIDLYLIHWPHCFKPGGEDFPKDANGVMLFGDTYYMDTWKVLEECVDEGKVKAIGISNFNSLQIQDMLDKCRIKPVNLQVEIHPYFNQEKLVKFAQNQGLTVTGYSPLGSPKRPWAKPGDPCLLEEPEVLKVASKHNKTPAQVIIRWFIQRNIIVIPKSTTPSRIRENFQVTDFELDEEDMKAIMSLNKNMRLIAPTVVENGKTLLRDRNAKYYPFQDHIEF